MKFFDKEGIQIPKTEASPTVLRLYDEDHNPIDAFLNYEGCSASIIIKLGGCSVKLYLNDRNSSDCEPYKSRPASFMLDTLESVQKEIDEKLYHPDFKIG